MLTFNSDALAPELDDRARRALWRDLFAARFGGVDMAYAADRPFRVQFRSLDVCGVGVVEASGSFTSMVRTSIDTNDDFVLGVNSGGTSLSLQQAGRETLLVPGSLTIGENTKPFALVRSSDQRQITVHLPRTRLLELVANVEDRLVRAISSEQPAVRYLRRYLDMLLGHDGLLACDGFEDDSELSGHIATTLLDLTTLALGAGREASELARMRGLRAARLREVLTAIKRGFANPAFSARYLAGRLGLSPRYIHDLLHETGAGFSERVLELRLQKARAMLASPDFDRMKVNDIAFASGFAEVSHFNRCFRRRFGATPTQYRGAGSGN